MIRLLLAATASIAICTAALAAEPAYLDDRSDAGALVRSFYNALNRHEYSRAWSYFGEMQSPPRTFSISSTASRTPRKYKS